MLALLPTSFPVRFLTAHGSMWKTICQPLTHYATKPRNRVCVHWFLYHYNGLCLSFRYSLSPTVQRHVQWVSANTYDDQDMTFMCMWWSRHDVHVYVMIKAWRSCACDDQGMTFICMWWSRHDVHVHVMITAWRSCACDDQGMTFICIWWCGSELLAACWNNHVDHVQLTACAWCSYTCEDTGMVSIYMYLWLTFDLCIRWNRSNTNNIQWVFTDMK